MQDLPTLRRHARHIFDAAVRAADPVYVLRRQLAKTPLPKPKAKGRYILIALGKAAPQMLQEALGHVRHPSNSLAVTHYENTFSPPRMRILRAGHPIPDENGFAASEEVMALLASARVEDQVIVLISGGGSALLPAPDTGITLTEKAAVNALLLESGLDIVQMNLVRQQLSQLKGGGMLRLASPAPVTSYILSDVIGNDLRAVASGPTIAPIGTAEDAIETLKSVKLWDRVPKSVARHLVSSKHPKTAPLAANNILIGSNIQSLNAAHSAVPEAYFGEIVSSNLSGDVAEAAEIVVQTAAKAQGKGPIALLFGGETTVRVTGTGAGGRNQELALRVALRGSQVLEGASWAFLSGGTDGRDGPTDAAGGLVDASSADRVRLQLDDPEKILANNDSNRALKCAEDLLVTGATGTNVADIQVFLLGNSLGGSK